MNIEEQKRRTYGSTRNNFIFLKRLEEICSKVETRRDNELSLEIVNRFWELDAITKISYADVSNARRNFTKACEIKDDIDDLIGNLEAYVDATNDAEQACIDYSAAWDKHEANKEFLSSFVKEYIND